MARFFFPTEELQTDEVALPQEVRRHLKARRLGIGARLELLDGNGLVCQAELLELDRLSGRARIDRREVLEQPSFCLTLLFGLAKGEKFDLVLQKGTELGIRRFVPVACRRSDRQLRPERVGQQMERWKRIVREAAQQSRRVYLPEVLAPRPLLQALQESVAMLRLVAWEQEGRSLASQLPPAPVESLALLVGPEGGLDESEVALAAQAGFIPVGLGPRILRCETAGIAVPGILLYLYGDLGAE